MFKKRNLLFPCVFHPTPTVVDYKEKVRTFRLYYRRIYGLEQRKKVRATCSIIFSVRLGTENYFLSRNN